MGGLSGVRFSWGGPSSEIPEVRPLGRDCWLREQLNWLARITVILPTGRNGPGDSFLMCQAWTSILPHYQRP